MSTLSPKSATPGGLSSRDQAFSPVYDDSTNTDPFTSFPDYSKINTGRHIDTRCDTFATPTRLGKRQETMTPTKMDMKSCDLLWLCEQCFKKEVSGFGKTIIGAVRGEFNKAIINLRGEMNDFIETHMKLILEKTNKIQAEVEAPLKIDFKPLNASVDSHKEETRRLESRLTLNMAQVFDEINIVRQQYSESEDALRAEVHEIHTEITRDVKDKLDNFTKMQETMNLEFSQQLKDVRQMQQDSSRVWSVLVPTLEEQFTKNCQQQPVNVDFTQVLRQLGNAQESSNVDFHRVLTEISKLEDTVGTNVVKVLENEFEKISEKLAKLQEVEEAASEFRHRKTEDTGCQTDAASRCDEWVQTDDKMGRHKKGHGRSTKKSEVSAPPAESAKKKGAKEHKAANGFGAAEEMKEKIRARLIKPQYNVFDFYKTDGCIQRIAKSSTFENTTFLVIFMNAIWIAVDTDHNDAPMLVDAHPVFQVAENIFCFYFTGELLIRFFAFRRKANSCRDFWFVFDTLLVSMMVVETWVITAIMLAMGSSGSSSLGNASILRIVRMSKMCRLTRMAKLLRAIPELIIILRAVGAATRIILVFLLIWSIVIYVFAILFRQISDGQDIGTVYFDSVPEAMNTLLLDGILPDNALLVNRVGAASAIYYPIMLIFLLFAAVTLMYMLIGVLVNVIHVVANAETEALKVRGLASDMRDMFKELGYPTEGHLDRQDFEKILMEPEIMGILQDAGVDMVVLVDMSGLIYEDAEKGDGMSFEYLVEMALKMRGANPATVKDIKQHLKFSQILIKDSVEQMTNHMTFELSKVHKEIHELHDTSSSEYSGTPSRTSVEEFKSTGGGGESPRGEADDEIT